MDKNKLIIAISIFAGAVILGCSLVAVQIFKQQSIERQQAEKLRQERIEKSLKMDIEEEQQTFSNNLKCQNLLDDLKDRWFNVVGIYYSQDENTCIVKYTEKGKTEEARIEAMQDID